jgi:hypothetical protein
VDETAFLAANVEHPTLLVTGFVALDRHRPLGVVEGRTAHGVADGWPPAGRRGWRLPPPSLSDPYAAYARGLADGLPQAALVVDHLHVEPGQRSPGRRALPLTTHRHASSRGASIRPGLNPTGRTSMPPVPTCDVLGFRTGATAVGTPRNALW